MSSKVIFITGASGAVGSATTPFFLREPDTRVILLLRADSEARLQKRLEDLLHYWQPDLPGTCECDRLSALAGDVTEDLFGLSEEVYNGLCEQTTHIVHCAANVKMNMPFEEARKISIDSTHNVIALARRCQQSGQFQKLDFVSTLGIAGKMQGLIPERPLDEHREYHNTYESTKAEAETLVLDAIGESLPATIHRPSMVVGDSVSGRIIHFQIFYYLCEFLSGKPTYGIIPDAGDVQLDTIPADYVARAIHWSSTNHACDGQIFHLCSGPEYSLPINHLVVELQAILKSRGEALPSIKRAPAGVFRAALPLLKLVTPQRVRKMLSNLPLFLNYLDDKQLFDNTATRKMLEAADICIPRVETYLQKVIDYYRQQRGR